MSSDITVAGNKVWHMEVGWVAAIAELRTATPYNALGEKGAVKDGYIFDTQIEAKAGASFWPGAFPDGFPKYCKVRHEVWVEEIQYPGEPEES